MRQMHNDCARSRRQRLAARDAKGDRTRLGAVPGQGVAGVKSYRVVYELDESGHWIATVPSVRGCHSYGRSINEARERIREALGLFVKDVARARLVDDVRLPAAVRALLVQQEEARARAEHEQRRASLAVARAVKRLTGDLGLSVRDAGELLKLSHQRVQQLREAAGTRRA